MTTLLEKARATPAKILSKSRFDERQMLELALAWFKGEIQLNQLKAALVAPAGYTAVGKAAICIRKYIASGHLRIEAIK